MSRRDWKSAGKEFIYRAQTPDEVSFVRERISLPNGHEFDYLYADSPYDVVYVVGLRSDGYVALIEQFRYLTQADEVEIPAGSPNEGETLADGALREFEEETGYRASQIEEIGCFFPSYGMTNQKGFIFLASGLEATEQSLDPAEQISVKFVPLSTAKEMVLDGRIRNAGASLGIILTIDRFAKGAT